MFDSRLLGSKCSLSLARDLASAQALFSGQRTRPVFSEDPVSRAAIAVRMTSSLSGWEWSLVKACLIEC